MALNSQCLRPLKKILQAQLFKAVTCITVILTISTPKIPVFLAINLQYMRVKKKRLPPSFSLLFFFFPDDAFLSFLEIHDKFVKCCHSNESRLKSQCHPKCFARLCFYFETAFCVWLARLPEVLQIIPCKLAFQRADMYNTNL